MRSKRHRSGRQLPWRFVSPWSLTILGALCLSDIVLGAASAAAATYATIPSRSTTIALTSDDQRLVVVNRETHSVSIIEVRNPVGQENTPPSSWQRWLSARTPAAWPSARMTRKPT